MDIEIKKYIFDIQESIDSINNYLNDKRDFKAFLLIRCLEEQLSGNLKL